MYLFITLLFFLFSVVMSAIGVSFTSGSQVLTSSDAANDDVAAIALQQMNDTLHLLADAVASALILGEEDIIATPSLQGTIGKVDGNALGNSSKQIGKSKLKIAANTTLDGCHIFKVQRSF